MGTDRSSLAIEQKKIQSFSHYYASSVSWANLEKTDYLLRLEVTPTSPGHLYTIIPGVPCPACMCSAYGAEKKKNQLIYGFCPLQNTICSLQNATIAHGGSWLLISLSSLRER